MRRFTAQPPVGREFQGLFPLDTMLSGPTVAVPDATTSPGAAALIDRAARYAPSATSFCRLASQPAPAPAPPGPLAPLLEWWRGGRRAAGVCGADEGGEEGMREPGHPESRELVQHLPHLELVGLEGVAPHGPLAAVGGARRGNWTRLRLRLYSQLPCWGVLNVTGAALRAWSLTRQLAPSSVCKVRLRWGPSCYRVRAWEFASVWTPRRGRSPTTGRAASDVSQHKGKRAKAHARVQRGACHRWALGSARRLRQSAKVDGRRKGGPKSSDGQRAVQASADVPLPCAPRHT